MVVNKVFQNTIYIDISYSMLRKTYKILTNFLSYKKTQNILIRSNFVIYMFSIFINYIF